jgi:hypothetical protein
MPKPSELSRLEKFLGLGVEFGVGLGGGIGAVGGRRRGLSLPAAIRCGE